MVFFTSIGPWQTYQYHLVPHLYIFSKCMKTLQDIHPVCNVSWFILWMFKLAFRSSFAHMGKSSSFHQNLRQKKWSAKLKSKKTAEKVWHVSLKAIMSTHLRVLLFAGCASGPCQRLAKGSSWKKRGGACQKQRCARVASERSRCGPRWKKGMGKSQKPWKLKICVM